MNKEEARVLDANLRLNKIARKECTQGTSTMSDPQYLTTIIKWFQELPLAARRGLSLANLHDLSKRLGGKHDEREVIEAWKRECDKLEAERDRAETTGFVAPINDKRPARSTGEWAEHWQRGNR